MFAYRKLFKNFVDLAKMGCELCISSTYESSIC